MKSLITTLVLTLFGVVSIAQSIRGVVLETNEKGDLTPIFGANVYWKGTSEGAVTDTLGGFTLQANGSTSVLVISYIGYSNDTISVQTREDITVILKNPTKMDEVTVTAWKPSTYRDNLDPINTMQMDEGELFKAACCNLSESFETNPAVDVSFTDAVTGTKQIKLLGLEGRYTQILSESMPYIRGLAASQGLTFIPGPWVKSIQVTQGVGSVVNGFESMVGQINVELKKPDDEELLFLNGYVNATGRTELNFNYSQPVSKNLSTGFLLHGDIRRQKNDRNNDGFLDMPVGNQTGFVNRWKYDNQKGIVGQFGFKLLYDQKQGGQLDFEPEFDQGSTNSYGVGIDSRRFETWGKIGYVFPQKIYKSIGLQMSFTNHNHNSYFGIRNYDATQNFFYSNLIYQSIIGNSNHKFRTGMSLYSDRYDESVEAVNYARTEIVPGAFFEYTWTPTEDVTILAGLRGDYNSIYGFQITPRLHTRWSVDEETTVRATVGKGFRTANIFSENLSVFATSRQISAGTNTTGAYGLNQEMSWNTGLSLTRDFRLNYRYGSIALDYHYTWFTDQVILDLDSSPQQALFYNQPGESFAHSLQAQVEYEPVRRLNLRMAYRYFDVQTDYLVGRLAKPFTARNRAFLNAEFVTRDRNWSFDGTLQWIDKQRIPNTESNPEIYRRDEFSQSFFMLHAQVTRNIGKWSVYVGGENLLDFQQPNPIIASDDPFGQYFDSSLVWGPIFGRMVYAGFRFKLEKE